MLQFGELGGKTAKTAEKWATMIEFWFSCVDGIISLRCFTWGVSGSGGKTAKTATKWVKMIGF